MPKIASIRMSEDLWELVQNESMRAGISASEFMRNATLAAIAYRMGHRGDRYGWLLREFGVLEDHENPD